VRHRLSVRSRAGLVGGVAAALVAGALLVTPAYAAPSTVKGIAPADARAAAETYADLVYASYGASIASATTMQTAVQAFLADPNDATLAAAKQAWLAARDDYLPTEAFRFYDGPIDNPDDGPEGQINAWPMDEAYVDYVSGNPGAGIVNNTTRYPTITTDVLVETNEKGGEKNISTGWHAIEFLLWGQDTTSGSPGQRPVSDYTSGANAARRGQYLRLTTDLLVDDLTGLSEEWAPDGAYRTKFLANPRKAIGNILRGIGFLSSEELSGERMAVAYETKDQEDEHSCFSDNTNADVVGDLVGIQRVYVGGVQGVSGTTISDLVAQVDPKLDAKLRGQIDESLRLARAYPAPFEQLIVGSDSAPGRAALHESITAIEDQGETIGRVAKKFQININ